MHKDYCVENLYNVKYFIKLLVASIVISSKLIAAFPLEAPAIGDTGELGILDGHREAAKFNTPTTKANTSTDLHITGAGSRRINRVFNDPPVAVGVVVGSEDGTIEYTNKISLEEDSVYEGTLGGVATNMCSTLKFGIDYQPRHGVVEIDETTGEFFYVPNNPNFRGPDSFGYFVSNDCFVNDNSATSVPRQKSKHKQIFVSVQPITGGQAFKKTLKQPLWGFWHYLNCVKCRRS